MSGVTFHCDGCGIPHTVSCAIVDGHGTGVFECPFSDYSVDLAWMPQDHALAALVI